MAEAKFQEVLIISEGVNPSLRIQVFMYFAEYLTIMGLYHQSDLYLRKLDSVASNIQLVFYDTARISRIRGWIELTQENFVEARKLTQKRKVYSRILLMMNLSPGRCPNWRWRTSGWGI
jgi:hypothetical protein